MFRPRVIPVLLLRNKGLVKTTKFKNPRYLGDPINAVKIFNDYEADELIFLDITASKENRAPSFDIIKKIAEESFMPFSIGGGIKNEQQIKQLLQSGAEKVCLNSVLFSYPDIINNASKSFGNQSIVAVMDVKKNLFGKYTLFSHSGTRRQKITPTDFAQDIENRGAGEIMINNIDRDGMMEGYDLELINKISQVVSIPVISCGGAGSLNDMKLAISYGASACAAGSLFVYHGKKKAVLINYPDNDKLKGV